MLFLTDSKFLNVIFFGQNVWIQNITLIYSRDFNFVKQNIKMLQNSACKHKTN